LCDSPKLTFSVARAVRKANKDLAELVNSREDHFAKVEIIQQKYSDLLHEMKRLERDHTKARKRADQLQKEKDQSRTEMNKAVSLKSKLETLCRELQKENKRIKVPMHATYSAMESIFGLTVSLIFVGYSGRE